TVRGELRPPYGGSEDRPGSDTLADPGAGQEGPAIVGDLDPVPLPDLARGGVFGVHLDERLAVEPPEGRGVPKAAVEEVVAGRAHHLERVATGSQRRCLATLPVRLPVRKRIQPLLLELPAVQLDFAARRPEPAVRKRDHRPRIVQPAGPLVQ